uniref:SGNH/GDSL hydrolase family protein n=1 Tax=Brevundimonas sp. TaxID=1871086 RepID=UPI0025BD3E5D
PADTLTETKTVEAFNGNTVWASRKYLSSLTVISAGVFPDIFANYTFANTNDGWSVTSGTLTPAADGSVFSEAAADAYIARSLSFLGSRYTRVIVELTRTANPSSGGFDGTLFYTTSGHGYSASHRKTIAANPALNVRTTLTFDMAALTAGGADWTSSTITAIRLDLDANGGGAFKIHSVKVVGGRLSAGTDYGANMKTGLVQLFGGTAPYDVSLTVTGFRTRYDLVWADPITGEIGVAEGVARGRDPEEYLPALPSGKVALWHVHVTPGAMELLPVHRFRNMVEIGREAEFQAIREHNLRCLPGLAKRMRTGAAFGLLGLGDSQTEIADGAEPEQQLVANTGRDGLRYLQGAIPSDTIAANVARFNEDGTPNASGPIIHIGWSYALEAAIEARSACAVSYFNLGIGGTTAAATLVNGLYNGGHPDRLAAAIATGAKLAVIAFGMNQLGDPAIFSQMVAIVAAFRAAGIECIILTVPGTNVFGPSGDQAAMDKWQATNDHLVRAALATDTAYVPFHMITGVGQEAALGISRESFSAANAVNHDGPYVMKKLGAFLAMMVTP